MEISPDIDFEELISNLPIGVYQVDNKGNFQYCNEGAAQILGYESPAELMKNNIQDLYIDQKLRDKLLGEMRKKGKLKCDIRWRTRDGLEILVSDFARFIYEDEEETGVQGIFVDASYKALFNRLNAGIFRIKSDLKELREVNEAVARIFGYESPEDMKGMSVVDLYEDREDFDTFIEELKKQEEVTNYPLQMKRKDGEIITISVNCRLLKNNKGDTIGREGTFTDITEQEKFRQLLKQPLGVYQVELRNEKPIIVYCNKTFAKMFGYSVEELFDFNIHDLYASKEDIYELEKELEKCDKKGKPLYAYPLNVRRKDKTTFHIEIYCLLVKDKNDNIIGRRGIVIDTTGKVEMNKILKTREDVQRFVHSFITSLIGVDSISQILTRVTETKVKEKFSQAEMELVREHSRDVLATYDRIGIESENLMDGIKDIVSKCNELGILKLEKASLEELKENLSSELQKGIAERIIEIRELQRRIQDTLLEMQGEIRGNRDLPPARGLSDAIRYLSIDMDELDYLYLLSLVRLLQNKIRISYHEIEGLRQYLLRMNNKQGPLDLKRIDIMKIIDDVAVMYGADALARGITIHRPKRPPLEIEAAPQLLERAMSNIVQNAVKYSFEREGYIAIRVKDLKEEVEIEVEDFGVGILLQEIKSRRIFEYGERGKFSYDRNRTGSGIGLSEANRIIIAHGGRIEIKSIPQVRKKPITKDTPHLTIVTVFLPRRAHGGE